MSSEYKIRRQMGGGYVVMDESDGAQMISVTFHNEAARLSEATKVILIRQLFDPAVYGPSVVERIFWAAVGFIVGFVVTGILGATLGWH